MAINLTNIVVSLRASDWEEMKKLQLLNHLVNNVRYNYFQVLPEGDGYRMFFFADINKWIDPTNLSTEELQNYGGLDV